MLQSQIEQLESQLQEEFTGRLEELTAEFTERLGETEKRLSAAARERDTLREQLQVATARFSDKIGQADKLQGEIMAEKDAKIDGLMAEGQKLQTKLHEVRLCAMMQGGSLLAMTTSRSFLCRAIFGDDRFWNVLSVSFGSNASGLLSVCNALADVICA